MMRMVALVLASFLAAPALAQDSAEMGQMRLYVQQLEERIRQLTGQNEQLLYELNQARTPSGQPPVASAGEQGASVTAQELPGVAPAQGGAAGGSQASAAQDLGSQDLGSMSIAADDPLIAPDGAGGAGEPIDLSTLAGGAGDAPVDSFGDPNAQSNTAAAPVSPDGTAVAGLPATPAQPTALSGSSRDEYDLAYGYILTGDFDLAEQSFQNWLAAFPGDQQAPDAQFWLAESQLQQGEYRKAANAFLAVYQAAPGSAKAPDALLKLGTALSALGERDAACATLAEVGRKYPGSSGDLMSRVDDEVERAGC